MKRSLSLSEKWYLRRLAKNSEEVRSIVPLLFKTAKIPFGDLVSILKEIILTNEILLTSYTKNSKGVYAEILSDPVVFPIYSEDNNLLSEEQIIFSAKKECMLGINIFDQFPYKFVVYIGTSNIYVLMNFHHIMFDWDSIYILLNQTIKLVSRYNSSSVSVKPSVGKYSEYVLKSLKNFEINRSKIHEYWKEKLSDCIEPLFTSRYRIKGEEFEDRRIFSFENNNLNNICAKFRCTPLTTLIAVLGLTLSKKFNKKDFLLNTPYSERYQFTDMPTLGVMLYSSAVRFQNSWYSNSLRDYFIELGTALREGFAHQPICLDELRAYLPVLNNMEHSSLQVFYNHQFYVPLSVAQIDKEILKNFELMDFFGAEEKEPRKALQPLTIESYQKDDSITVKVLYSLEHFTQEEIDSLVDLYQTVLLEIQSLPQDFLVNDFLDI